MISDHKKAPVFHCDAGMFAYVKDNRLYITGMVINQARRCRDYETQQSFFEGKGN